MFTSFHSDPPKVVVTQVRPPEQEIYQKLWDTQRYRANSPGEAISFEFLNYARPKAGETIIDFGCGTGRASVNLSIAGLDVTSVDFTTNCLDPEARALVDIGKIKFVQADLTKSIDLKADYGFCTDVLEHIAPENVDAVIQNCVTICGKVFFQISTEDEVMGKMVGQKLHLTVEDYAWWEKKFQSLNCKILWAKDLPGYCLFYVQQVPEVWIAAEEIEMKGELNAGLDVVLANVKENIRLGFQQVQPYPTNDVEVMIVGGGPSLKSQIGEIRRLRDEGVKLVCLNNAYQYCLDHDIKPSAFVMVDARPFNLRFVENVIPDCKYFIASQCDPAVFGRLLEVKDQTYIWHTSAEEIQDALKEVYPKCYPVPGGSTVLLRAIPLFRMLGFKRFHVFGCDSCLEEGQHHAYAQKENDDQVVIPVRVGGEVFYCNPWMVSQAREFVDLVGCMGDGMELEIYGGLLRQILKSGADSAALEEI